MDEAVYLQLLEGPLETDLGSLPGVVPLNSSQMVLTDEAQVLEMVAVPPKLGLIPASSLPLDDLTFLMTTLRATEFLQLPQARYSLPKLATWKPSIVTVPLPLLGGLVWIEW
jgi:hypothetical protein